MKLVKSWFHCSAMISPDVPLDNCEFHPPDKVLTNLTTSSSWAFNQGNLFSAPTHQATFFLLSLSFTHWIIVTIASETRILIFNHQTSRGDDLFHCFFFVDGFFFLTTNMSFILALTSSHCALLHILSASPPTSPPFIIFTISLSWLQAYLYFF
jgi:hypothetical protein